MLSRWGHWHNWKRFLNWTCQKQMKWVDQKDFEELQTDNLGKGGDTKYQGQVCIIENLC